MTGKFQVKLALLQLNTLLLGDRGTPLPETSSSTVLTEADSIPNGTHPKRTKGFQGSARKGSQIVALLPIYFLQFCYGMNTGFPAIVTPQLREDCSEFSITSDQESWIVSVDNLATPFVCILSGFFQQKFGPKRMLLFACLPYFFGWIFAAAATSIYPLLVSRLLVGVSHALVTTTVYTVEVTSKEMRGTYSLLESVLRCLGCLLIYALGFRYRWNTIALFAPIIPLLACCLSLVIPESPVFLLKKRDPKQAAQSLKRLYGSQYKVSEEMEIILMDLKELKRSKSQKPVWRDLPEHPEIYKPFCIVLLLSIIQQFSGMTILRAYVVKIFNELYQHPSIHIVPERLVSELPSNLTSGPLPETLLLSSNFTSQVATSSGAARTNCTGVDQTSQDAYVAAIVIGLVRLLSSLLLSRLLIHYPRRRMYMGSALLTSVALIAFATTSHITQSDQHPSYWLHWLPLLTASLLVFTAQLGVQTLPNLLSGELFTSDNRAICKGFTRSFTCLLIVLSLKLFPLMESQLGLHGTFFSFGLIMGLSVPLVYCVLPETKDLGLEVIRGYFTPAKTMFYVDDLILTSGEASDVSSGTNSDTSSCVISDESRLVTSGVTGPTSDATISILNSVTSSDNLLSHEAGM